MTEVGVRELKTRASEIVRKVRRGARYVVTYRGRPVAVLTPVEGGRPGPGTGAAESAWSELERVGVEIGKGWRSRLSSAELLSSMRR